MVQTKLFKSNQSQAVRLPKDVAFPANVTDVTIIKDGPRRIIVPTGAAWDDIFDAPGVDIERNQPPMQEREAF